MQAALDHAAVRAPLGVRCGRQRAPARSAAAAVAASPRTGINTRFQTGALLDASPARLLRSHIRPRRARPVATAALPAASLNGAFALMQRGGCYFSNKILSRTIYRKSWG